MADQQPAGATVQFSSEFRRLQRIEQCIINAVEAAGNVTEELSKFGSTCKNQEAVEQQCQAFLEHIKVAQDLVHEIASTPATDRGFEATVYQSMARAHLASEKVSVVAQHMQTMHEVLEDHHARKRLQAQHEGRELS
ncbi:hypothetical protein DUNSADRAFT_12261 [Dunaliella salina]|uniref:Mediator of RNA polymerase II transcription subunit 11 n=1 Tax=Dunaliella salina TaxID=3046 RepID=A0ABQ7H3Y0_DUNSA|nr:hypothetical protein DUNSADRAFT_12261 [Dunaliella salina]|eukprot:KAF5841563.1 hypothetical protein DUNSADRAFT_12261 [Dunaliella salina]